MRNRILAVLFLAILAILAGWFIFKPARKVEATALVEKEDLVLTTSISGKLKASREATLSFPISGKITQIASVSAAVGEGAAATVKALTLADLSSFYFEAEVDEIDVAGLKVGQDVSVELDAYRDR